MIANIKEFLKDRFGNKPNPSVEEEQNQVIERAGYFDRLLADPGWLEVQNHVAEQINRAIVQAAQDDPLKAEEQRLHVLQWNAKRELNDSVLHYIAETRRNRDDLISQKREEESYVHYASSN